MHFIRLSRDEGSFTEFDNALWKDCALLVHMTSTKWTMTFDEIRKDLHHYQTQEREKLSLDVEIWEMIVKAIAIKLLRAVPEKIESISRMRDRFAKNETNQKLLDALEAGRRYIDSGDDKDYSVFYVKMNGFRL